MAECPRLGEYASLTAIDWEASREERRALPAPARPSRRGIPRAYAVYGSS